MKIRIVSIIVSLLVFNCFLATGQKEKITPVSPEAAALAKEINYPVNFNTGIPNIQIPLYEINVGNLKLPVDLSYHAGGFRINEQATRSGLGWSLSSDLQITRTVNGKDDFSSPSGYINNSLVKTFYPDYFTCPGCEYPTSHYENYFLATGQKDASPDKFNYKLLNKTGSFYFMKNEIGTGYSIVPVPFDNIWIQYNSGQFIITDTDGTKYYFGEPGSGDINQILSLGIEVSESAEGSVRSAWKCKKIVSAQGIPEITFSYVPKTMTTYRSYNDNVEYYSNDYACPVQSFGSNEAPMNNTTNYDYLPTFYQITTPKYMMNYGNGSKSYFHVPYLDENDIVVDAVYERLNSTYGNYQNVYGLSVSEINFRGGKVKFNGTDKLNYIQILGPSNEQIKTISFFHSYTAPNYSTQAKLYNGQNFQGTLYLDSLQITNQANTYERYALQYESDFCFGNHLKGQDAWGYPNQSTMEIADANNTGGNMMTLPTIKLNQDRFYRKGDRIGCTDFATDIPITIIGNNRAEIPNEEDMKKGILRRIVYPTGGYVDFDFEANRYNETFSWSGLYNSLPQMSGGLRIRSINTYDKTGKHAGQKYYTYGMLEEGTGLLINKPALAYEDGGFHYGAVSFEQKTVYLEVDNTSGYGVACFSKDCLFVLADEKKTTYHPASMLDYTYGTGAPIYYEKVTEYNQDLGRKTGKTVYEYYPPNEFYDFYNAPMELNSRITGTNINALKTDGLWGVQKSIKSYLFNPNAKSYEVGDMYKLINKKDFTYIRYLKPQQIRVNYAFMHTIYDIVPGDWQGEPWDLYDPYAYFITSPYYDPSADFIYGEYGIPVGKLLPDQISETSYSGTDTLNTLTWFEYDNLPYLNPSKVMTYDSKFAEIEKRIKYAYDFSGTSVYDSMVNRNMISMPVEEIETNVALGKQVARNKVAFNKFSVGFGVIAPEMVSTSVNGQPLQVVTYFQEYDQYGNVLQLTGRDGVPVSYLWGYQSLYPVAELKGQTYAGIPASYKSNSQITNPVNDAGLRTLLSGLNLPNVMSDIYTYRPLIGISSHTAPNSKTSYFEYDPIGRLNAKKDNEGNILSQYDYTELSYGLLSPWKSYANVPAMHSHNAAGPGFWYFWNKVIEGGKYTLGGSQPSVDATVQSEAEEELPTGSVIPADAPPANNTVEVALVYLDDDMDGIYPVYYVDFIQNDAVVATFKCGSQMWSPPAEYTAHIPVGTYRVSIRVDADQNYDNGALFFSVSDLNTTYSNFKNGDEVVFTTSQSYEIMVGSWWVF